MLTDSKRYVVAALFAFLIPTIAMAEKNSNENAVPERLGFVEWLVL